MWKRFLRALRSLFGGAVAAIEDPKLILEQNIRELNDKVPELNRNIATVKSGVIVLERQLAKLETDERDLTSKIQAAIGQGRDDIAASFALGLERTQGEMVKVRDDLASAQRAYEKALELKKVFMRERERKIREAQEVMQAYERSKWQAKIADTLQQFETAGSEQTHSEMVAKLNEKAAKNEAMMEMAVESVDTSSLKVEEEAEKLRAMDLVNRFKQQMAVGQAPSTQAAQDLQIQNPAAKAQESSGSESAGAQRDSVL